MRDDYPDWEGRSIILYPVCKAPCHRELTTLFEHRGEPLIKNMLEGNNKQLDRGDQIALGKWFVKTDMLLCLWRNVVDRNVGPHGYEPPNWARHELVRQGLLAMLASQGLPPANSLVRLAHLVPTFNMPAGTFSRPGLGRVSPLDLGVSINALPRGVVSESVVTGTGALVYLPEEPERFVQVFPPGAGSVSWPPAVALGPRDLAALRAAWEHTDEHVVGDFPDVRLPPI